MITDERSKMIKNTIYTILFFIINFAMGIFSYWLRHHMSITSNYNYSDWSIAAVIILITWIFTLIKVTNPKHLRICSYYFLGVIFYEIISRILVFTAKSKHFFDGLYYLTFPFLLGYDKISKIIDMSWYYLLVKDFIIVTLFILFYIMYFLKMERLKMRGNRKLILFVEMTTLFLVFFEWSLQLNYTELVAKLAIFNTSFVMLIWLFCIFFYRKNKSVLFHILVIWTCLFFDIGLYYVVDKNPELFFLNVREISKGTYIFILYALFPAAELLCHNYYSDWNWGIAVCVSVITIYAVFSYVKVRISEKKTGN